MRVVSTPSFPNAIFNLFSAHSRLERRLTKACYYKGGIYSLESDDIARFANSYGAVPAS